MFMIECFLYLSILCRQNDVSERIIICTNDHKNYDYYFIVLCPGPEIDPFWYVGRGVRPIGRFGKRHSQAEALDSGEVKSIVRMLLLLNSLRNKQKLGNGMDAEDMDWFQ